MGNKKSLLGDQETYVFIDVSNIRSACLKTLGFRLDFIKLLDYFRKKYPNLQDVRYYEGIAKDDKVKRRQFNLLKKYGYTICSLERKSYNAVDVEEYAVKCPNCNTEWVAEITRERKVMKSNVDVYLATDMVAIANRANGPARLVLVSCDGDYAEAIKTIISLNDNVIVNVLATPSTKDFTRNTLSVRLKQLYRELPLHRYDLASIGTIQRYVS